MTVSHQTRDQVGAVLSSLVVALQTGDAAALDRLAAPGLSGFWIDRPVRGPDGLAAAVRAPFTLADTEISCEGTIAWVAARLVPGTGTPGPEGRFTAVLRGTGHAWLLSQVHASLPA